MSSQLKGGTTIGGYLATHLGNLANQLSGVGNISINGGIRILSTPSSTLYNSGLILKDETSGTEWQLHSHGDRLRLFNGTSEYTIPITTDTVSNATTAGGLAVHSSINNEANKIVRTDANGYANFGWINTISGDNATTTISRVYASSDGYLRYYTLDNFAAQVLAVGSTKNAHTHADLPLVGGTLTGGLSGVTASFSGQITSTLANGTAPLVITSATRVDNLNVQYLNGFQPTSGNTGNTIVQRDANGDFSARNITASGVVSAAGASGFSSSTYVNGARNPIWRFGNADTYGLSYFQGTAGIGSLDTIGMHFGTATAAGSKFQFISNGNFVTTTINGVTINTTAISGTSALTSSGALGLNAGGTNQNIILTPTGTGIVSIPAQLSISSGTYPPLHVERTTTETSTPYGALRLQHKTSADMADGFGAALYFAIQDSAGVSNNIAYIAGTRSGADTSGRLSFYTFNSGSTSEKMTILPTGLVGIGKTPTTYALEVNGDVQATNFRGTLVGNASSATKWESSKVITLAGDATGSVNIDGNSDVTLTVTVIDDSHYHDGRYYTAAQADSMFATLGHIQQANKGGTGCTSYAVGDILYANGTASLGKLAKGTANQLLGMNSGATAPEYKTLNGTTNAITVTHAANVISLDIGSNVVTIDGSQTLTNKTLTAPKISSGDYIYDTNGNEILGFISNGTAVNYIILSAAISGSYPSITTSGSDTDIGLLLNNKGNGQFNIGSTVTTGSAVYINASSLTSGKGLTLSSTSVNGVASGSSILLNLSRSGANTNASHTAYGIYSNITNTGTTSTNIAGYFSASGATNNYAAIFNTGNVGIATLTPNFDLDINGDIRIRSANKLYFGGTGASDNDVSLYRSTADILKTDDNFEANSFNNLIIYKCTGVADDVAITNLVNHFLDATDEWNGTTALTLKLIISGTVGLSATPAYGTGGTGVNQYRHFNFASNQARDARVQIDWSNAQGLLVNITSSGQNRSMIYHSGSGCSINHVGLSCKVIVNSGSGVGIYNDSTNAIYINDSYCYGNALGICNDSGISYINNSYCYGGSFGVINVLGSTFLNNSYCYGVSYGFNNNATGTSYINNSYCWGGSYGVTNYSSGITYINNSFCLGVIGVNNYQTGTTHISNSYCYGYSESSGTIAGVSNTSGIIHLSNSHCVAVSLCATVSASNVGYGVFQANGSGKLFINNCKLIGYRHTTNTSGVGYGLYIGTSNTNCIVTVTNSFFPSITVTNQTQTNSIYCVGGASTVKFHIQGNLFYTANIRIDGGSYTSITAVAGKYMPAYANMFSIA